MVIIFLQYIKNGGKNKNAISSPIGFLSFRKATAEAVICSRGRGLQTFIF